MNITSLEKGLILLEQFARSPYKYSITELSHATGINRTTVYRLLLSLQQRDLVSKIEGQKKYKLGSKVYRLGIEYRKNFSTDDFVPALLDEISQKTSESVGYAILEDNRVLSLYESEIAQPLKMRYQPGLYYPMNRGCYGKCLMAFHDPLIVEELLQGQDFQKLTPRTLVTKEEILAEYESIREKGYVMSLGEWTDYIYGVGIPLRDPSGRVAACIALSFIRAANETDEEVEEKCRRLLETLKEFAPRFTRNLI